MWIWYYEPLYTPKEARIKEFRKKELEFEWKLSKISARTILEKELRSWYQLNHNITSTLTGVGFHIEMTWQLHPTHTNLKTVSRTGRLSVLDTTKHNINSNNNENHNKKINNTNHSTTSKLLGCDIIVINLVCKAWKCLI